MSRLKWVDVGMDVNGRNLENPNPHVFNLAIVFDDVDDAIDFFQRMVFGLDPAYENQRTMLKILHLMKSRELSSQP